MTRRILTVEDTFAIRGRGLVLAPFLDEAEARAERFAVELRKPSGEIAHAQAHAQVPFINPPPPSQRAQLLILDASKNDVPIGTEVWTVDSVAPADGSR